MTTKEAAERLGMSEATLRLMIRENAFPFAHYHIGKSGKRAFYYINVPRFEKYLDGTLAIYATGSDSIPTQAPKGEQ